jgi:hypothetical protein
MDKPAAGDALIRAVRSAGWAIDDLRERGAHPGIEIDDAALAFAGGDEQLARRNLERFPALRDAVDRHGTPPREHAMRSSNGAIAALFDV